MNNAGDWASNAKFAVGLEQVNLAGEQDSRTSTTISKGC